MASILKRKRGANQTAESEALKKAKAAGTATLEKNTNGDAAWDKLFAPLNKTLNNELAILNGSTATSSDVEDTQMVGVNGTPKKNGKKSKKSSKSKGPAWRVSAPFGGRMIDVDPVFTQDEKYGSLEAGVESVILILFQVSHCCTPSIHPHLLHSYLLTIPLDRS